MRIGCETCRCEVTIADALCFFLIWLVGLLALLDGGFVCLFVVVLVIRINHVVEW